MIYLLNNNIIFLILTKNIGNEWVTTRDEKLKKKKKLSYNVEINIRNSDGRKNCVTSKGLTYNRHRNFVEGTAPNALLRVH